MAASASPGSGPTWRCARGRGRRGPAHARRDSPGSRRRRQSFRHGAIGSGKRGVALLGQAVVDPAAVPLGRPAIDEAATDQAVHDGGDARGPDAQALGQGGSAASPSSSKESTRYWAPTARPSSAPAPPACQPRRAARDGDIDHGVVGGIHLLRIPNGFADRARRLRLDDSTVTIGPIRSAAPGVRAGPGTRGKVRHQRARPRRRGRRWDDQTGPAKKSPLPPTTRML